MRDSTVVSKCYTNKGNPEVIRWVPRDAILLLDIGCGAGDNAKLLAQMGKRVNCITFSKDEAILASKWCENVYVHDLETGLPADLDSNYDCVICSHVLEHICYPQLMMQDLQRSIVPGGILILALPNLLFWKSRIQLLFGKFRYTETGVMDYTHVRWYTLNSLSEIVETYGFEVINRYGSGYIPVPFLRKLLGMGIARPIDRWAARKLPGLFGHQLILIAKKKVNETNR